MSYKIYAGALLLAFAVACHSSSDKIVSKDSTKVIQDSTAMEGTPPETDSATMIVPGRRAGKIYLGQDMEEVFAVLGKADDGDAAMGSALGIWSKDKHPIVIFSSYRDSNMVIKAVKQVSVSSPDYRTTGGLHTGSKLAALMDAYPGLKLSETYVHQQDTLKVYDSLAEGIAFDIRKDTVTSVTVHIKNRAANAVYLPVHPDWKKL